MIVIPINTFVAKYLDTYIDAISNRIDADKSDEARQRLEASLGCELDAIRLELPGYQKPWTLDKYWADVLLPGLDGAANRYPLPASMLAGQTCGQAATDCNSQPDRSRPNAICVMLYARSLWTSGMTPEIFDAVLGTLAARLYGLELWSDEGMGRAIYDAFIDLLDADADAETDGPMLHSFNGPPFARQDAFRVQGADDADGDGLPDAMEHVARRMEDQGHDVQRPAPPTDDA